MRELFEPDSIAVIGAAREETKVGHIVLKNLIDAGFQGRLYPINPKAEEIIGLKCYKTVLEVPDGIDLAVVCVPSPFVPRVMEDTGKKGIKVAIIISAGFRETGKVGAELERQVGDIAKQYGIRVLGPNCLGVINTQWGMNATFTNNYPNKGSIAISSQSGAICSTLLDWASQIKVGFSKFVSVGNKLDLDEADLLRYLREDEATRVIGIYIEGTDRGTEFMKEALLTSASKPILALKAGRTSTGAKAASSHTGALSGSDRVYDAALSQSGVIRVKTIEELFDLLLVFSNTPLPRPGGVAIVTNAGGLGVLAADACGDYGLTMASFTAETVATLKSYLPEEANFYNPVDVIGDANTDRYQFAIQTVKKDPNVSSIVVLLAPTDLVDIRSVAGLIAGYSGKVDLPIVGAFVGGQDMAEGVALLRKAGVPNFDSPDRAVRALASMYEYNLAKSTNKTKQALHYEGDKITARAVLDAVIKEGRLSLTEAEGKRILKAYGIQVPAAGLAMNEDQAVSLAESIGYPVVLKIESPDIAHKTDVGGVAVNVGAVEEVRKQYNSILVRVRSRMPNARIDGISVEKMFAGREVIVGMVRDDQFGPVMTFGLGGIFVEIMKDVVQRVVPLSELEIGQMVRSIKAYPILTGARGKKPADIAALKEVIGRVAQIAIDFPEIAEFEINPVIVGDEGQGCCAVDALATIRRVVK